MKYISIYGVLLTVLCLSSFYDAADRENRQTSLEEDSVFPRKWKKLGFPFYFPTRPVCKLRFRSFCKEIITQCLAVIYVALIAICFLCNGSFSFMNRVFLWGIPPGVF